MHALPSTDAQRILACSNELWSDTLEVHGRLPPYDEWLHFDGCAFLGRLMTYLFSAETRDVWCSVVFFYSSLHVLAEKTPEMYVVLRWDEY